MSPASPLTLSQFFAPQFFDALASTNDEAKAQAEAGAPEGRLIVAGQQTAGRGRQGREFSSPPGNLYMSLILRPQGPPAKRALLSFVVAVALGEAVSEVLPGSAIALKWPNDVLLAGRKVSGILLESTGGADGWLVAGIGVNVLTSPPHLKGQAISLAEAGWEGAGRDAFLEVFAAKLEDWYRRWQHEGFDPVRAAWLKRAAFLGQAIEVRLPDRSFKGTFVNLDSDGTLIVQAEDGSRQSVGAGEIFPVA